MMHIQSRIVPSAPSQNTLNYFRIKTNLTFFAALPPCTRAEPQPAPKGVPFGVPPPQGRGGLLIRGVIRCKITFLGGWEVFWGGVFEEACQCGRAERGRWCEWSGEKTVLKEVAKWLEVLF